MTDLRTDYANDELQEDDHPDAHNAANAKTNEHATKLAAKLDIAALFLEEWDSGHAYPTGYFSIFDDDVYVALVPTTGDQPDSSPTKWRLWPIQQGADGQNAYEVAVAEGFAGTVTEWLTSLQGAAGDPAPLAGRDVFFEQEGTAEEATGSKPYVLLEDSTIGPLVMTGTGGPTGTAIVGDVLVDGVSIFTDDAHRPTLPVGALIGTIVTPDIADHDMGGIVSTDIVTVGTEVGDTGLDMLVRDAVGVLKTTTGTVTAFNIPFPPKAEDDPDGYKVGDLIVCAFGLGSGDVDTLPAGWVELASPVIDAAVTLHEHAIAKIAGPAESGAQSVTLTLGTPVNAVTFAVQNPDDIATVVDDLDLVVVDSANAGATLPAVTSTVDAEILIAIYTSRFTAGAQGDPTLDGSLTTILRDCTERIGANTNIGLAVGWKALPTAGAVGTLASSVSPLTARWCARVLTLKKGLASDSPGANVGFQVRITPR